MTGSSWWKSGVAPRAVPRRPNAAGLSPRAAKSRACCWVIAIGLSYTSASLAYQAPPSPAKPKEPAPPVRGSQAGPGSVATEAVKPPDDYIIGADDVLVIAFRNEKDMSAEVAVRPDGKITLQLINDVLAAGSTTDQLRQKLVVEAAKFIEDPSVTVIVKQINSRKVFIMGEIGKPGPYNLSSPMTVMQLIALAGGLRDFARRKEILIMRSEGGRQVTLPFDYTAVIKGAKLQQNIVLKPGDTIVVP